MRQRAWLGIDLGSVTAKVAVLDEGNRLIHSEYVRTRGCPLDAVKEALRRTREAVGQTIEVVRAGVTGSGRHLIARVVGAAAVKNEITAHAVAAGTLVDGVQTILEIGGQDSKIILLRNGVAVDFAMNTVCAAGTGSFLDQQAARLNLPIEQFGELALRARHPARIAGRCSVFAETDMIQKQQSGHEPADLVAGLCRAMVRNYLNNVAKGKEILPVVVFQGGVAANVGIRKALEDELGLPVVVPPHFGVMGAIGMALIARDGSEVLGGLRGIRGRALRNAKEEGNDRFRGFELCDQPLASRTIECEGCPNSCEVIEVRSEGRACAFLGDRCGRYSNSQQDV
ncbi:MAG: acyl-CoA dehydratase activase [Candidatus Sumerlaeia bacterium]|nr:acyl-CoA dehydratase activase [Candidatus Sumerlaeia bacterium]